MKPTKPTDEQLKKADELYEQFYAWCESHRCDECPYEIEGLGPAHCIMLFSLQNIGALDE